MIVETVLRIDKFLSRHMPLVLLCAVALGVCFADTFVPFQNYMGQMLMMVTFANSLGGGFRDLKETVRRPVPILVTFVVMHLVMPALVLVLSVGGYTLGFWTAKTLRLDFPSLLTLAVLIGFRNISAGIVIAQQHFSVDALLPVSITPLFQQLLLSLVTKGFWRTKDGRAYRAKLESTSNT